jgi:hypothetical protein
MKERLAHSLHPETQKAMKLAHRLAGKEPRIKRVNDLPHNTRAVLKRPTVPSRPYEILYRKGEEPVLDHLITHEVGHIVRLHRVPEADRLAPFVSRDCRRYAALQLASRDEFVPLLARGLAPETVGDMMMDWHEALAEQVANGPVDLRIEQWVHDQFPGLRKAQERSLTDEVERGYDSFHPLIQDFIPPSIYWPTIAMNAAQAVHVARLYRKPELLEPYADHRLIDVGEQLVRIVFDASDQGHRSDMAATNRWAQELRLTGWFEWAEYAQGQRENLVKPLTRQSRNQKRCILSHA